MALFPYTVLKGWLLRTRGGVFTVRYGLDFIFNPDYSYLKHEEQREDLH